MTTLTCRDGADRLTEYLEGTIPETERVAIDTHVAGCGRCAAFIRAYRATARILRDATSFEIPAAAAAALERFLEGRRSKE